MTADPTRDTGSEPRTEDLGYRLDALLDELVAAGWSGEFDARERAALNRLGWVRAEAARADLLSELRAAVEGLPGADRVLAVRRSATSNRVAEFRAAVLALLGPPR